MAVALTLLISFAFLSSPADGEVVVFFGGDTTHGENYQDGYSAKGKRNIILERDYHAGFERLAPMVDRADLVLLNLETTLTNRRDPPHKGKISYLYSDPRRAPASLKRLGVDVVTIANNHAYDFGAEGLRDTLSALENVGIHSFGAGEDLAAAEEPYLFDFVTEAGPVSIAILAAFERRDSYAPFHFYVGEGKPGVNPIDPARLARQIERLKSREPKPLIVVTPHWGQNYVWRTPELREFAEGMARAGADLVIGHGAHCLQEIERIGDTLVFYSIGNFVFQKRVSYASRKAPPYSLPMRVIVEPTTDGLRFEARGYPIVSDNTLTDYKPRPVTAQEMAEVKSLLLERDTTGVLAERAAWTEDEIGPYVAIEHRVANGVSPVETLTAQEAWP